MNGHLLPRDAGWHSDKELMADLSQVNADIARYVLRQLDVDAQRAEPIPADDEHVLGTKLVELGERLQHRAAQRQAQTGHVIEGETPQPQALEPGRAPQMDNGP